MDEEFYFGSQARNYANAKFENSAEVRFMDSYVRDKGDCKESFEKQINDFARSTESKIP